MPISRLFVALGACALLMGCDQRDVDDRVPDPLAPNDEIVIPDDADGGGDDDDDDLAPPPLDVPDDPGPPDDRIAQPDDQDPDDMEERPDPRTEEEDDWIGDISAETLPSWCEASDDPVCEEDAA